jgi:aspartate/methionine/tyrosine aminotransferase
MYFNHLMAIQMSGGGRNVVYGECDKRTLHPDLKWLRQQLLGQKNTEGSGSKAVRMVILTNPCNPTGSDSTLN